MENTNTVKRVFAIDRNKALSALVTGELELDVDVNAELSEQVDTLASELKAKAVELDEIKAEAEAKAEAVTAKEAAEASLKAAEEKHLKELKAIGEQAEALRAEIKALKETPVTKKVTASATPEVVDPAAEPVAPVAFKKQTPDERREAMQARTRELAKNQ